MLTTLRAQTDGNNVLELAAGQDEIQARRPFGYHWPPAAQLPGTSRQYPWPPKTILWRIVATGTGVKGHEDRPTGGHEECPLVAWIQTVVATRADLCVDEELTEQGCWSSPVEGFARSIVEFMGDAFEVFQRECAQVGAFRKVLAEESVGVLV